MLISLGLDFRTASLAERERFRLTGPHLPGIAERRARFGIDELALLSTCNRVELYASTTEQTSRAFQRLAGVWQPDGADTRELLALAAWRRERETRTHLVRVAAGLESQVPGDPQILSQVRAAYRSAVSLRLIGPCLDRLFQAALRAGRRVRAETTFVVAERAIGSLAAEFALTQFGPRLPHRVLVVGAGRVATQVTRRLQRLGVMGLTVANRTLGGAQRLAQETGGRAVPLAALPEELPDADLVFAAVGGDHPLICRADLASLRGRASPRRRIFVDLSMPRAIEPAVGSIPGVNLFDLQLLDRLQQGDASRSASIASAEAIVAQEVRRSSARPYRFGPSPVLGATG